MTKRHCLQSALPLLIIFLWVSSGAQSFREQFRLNKINEGGVLFEKGWRYHLGDNSGWAKPNFDDSNWPFLNINQPASELLQYTKGEVTWLRLWFSLDSSDRKTPLSLLINQYAASEVYIDGQLVQRLGTISSKEVIELNPHNKPIPFQLNDQASHLLAIRFACPFPSSHWVLKKAEVVPLIVRLQATNIAVENLQKEMKESRLPIGVISINAVFGLLFLLVFLFYKRQPLNLFFSLFNISLAAANCSALFLIQGQYGLNGYVFLQLLLDILGRIIGSTNMVFMFLALFQRVPPFIKWFLIYTLTIDFVFINLFPVQYVFVNHFTHLGFTIIFLWLCIRAFKNYNLKDWFIGLLAFFSFGVNLNYFLALFWGVNAEFVNTFFPIVMLPSMIIYLSLKYANVNTSLEKQLIQVKNLSEANLRGEQEKQQILANQNEMLDKEVVNRTSELKQSLEELKSTQSQLIQSEKMASLGELTAGIAHEIQNPLNFVNNFSEVNKEMINEATEEIDKGNYDEVKNIFNDIKDNEEKINHHGKRADAIVKGMLQHSRKSEGIKEPTDINALCDEYLRLSYHGLRAKDKSFNSDFKTDFDNSIGKINIIPQDIGRVLLNLINNAFYAVNERQKITKESYQPTVLLSSKKTGANVILTVKDNGNGIPQNIVDKIFQPFFTTKPTGQGTGLGLSLSYDIIKAQGGEIKVETKEEEGTAFTIQLPIV